MPEDAAGYPVQQPSAQAPAQQAQASADRGSLTVTQPASSSTGPPTQVLTLREPEDNRVQWTDDTVDNENMGKQKSNKCCIYKKPRTFGESSSESSYDGNDDSSDESEVGGPGAQPAGGNQHDHPGASSAVPYDRPTFTRTRRSGASGATSTWSQQAKTPEKGTK